MLERLASIMVKKRKKRPDVNELAKVITDTATDTDSPDTDVVQPEDTAKNPKAVKSGHLGGIKGGKARAKKLTPQQRSEIARKAALKRWQNASQ